MGYLSRCSSLISSIFKALGNYVKMQLDVLKLDARRNCYPAKDYILIENWDGSPISSPVCTIIRRNPIRAMSQNAICIKFVSNNKVQYKYFRLFRNFIHQWYLWDFFSKQESLKSFRLGLPARFWLIFYSKNQNFLLYTKPKRMRILRARLNLNPDLVSKKSASCSF